MTPAATEGQLLKSFLEAVPYRIPGCLVFERPIVNARATAAGRTWHVRSGVPGMADAYCVAPGGKHVEIEGKSARGQLRDAQIAWQKRCAELEIPHLVLRARKGEAPSDTVSRWCDELRSILLPAGV